MLYGQLWQVKGRVGTWEVYKCILILYSAGGDSYVSLKCVIYAMYVCTLYIRHSYAKIVRIARVSAVNPLDAEPHRVIQSKSTYNASSMDISMREGEKNVGTCAGG